MLWLLLTGCATEVDCAPLSDDGPCPDGMVQVGDFCIDAFEATVEGDAGYADQLPEWPETATEGVAAPIEGVLPTVELSWYQAWGACLNAGKHLCTVDEWQKACGETAFPWGDEPAPDTRCAVPDAEGSTSWESLQPTGSLEDCRTPEGVYDQVGNAWEWADPETVDADGAPETAKMGGAYYAGQGNAGCQMEPMREHAPWFQGTIAARCCVEANE